jgi:hypothetical protein
VTTPHILEILAKRVEAAPNLDELRAALIAIEEEVESYHVDSADIGPSTSTRRAPAPPSARPMYQAR